MSKKNNQGTRRNLHAARLAKEKEEAEKRKAKLHAKQERLATADKLGLTAPKRLKRKAKKGVRIKKHVVVRGVKVTDAESKRKVKEMLAAEEAMKEMMMDAEGGEDLAEAEQQQGGGAGDQAMRAVVGSGPGSGKKERRVGTGGGARLKGSSSIKVKGKGGKSKGGAAAGGEGMALD